MTEPAGKLSLRAAMPITSGFVDAMREAFGRDEVNGWVMGQNGGLFWARENGQEWGRREAMGGQAMRADAYLSLGRPLLPTGEDEA